MAEVMGRLDAHMHEDLVQRDVAPLPRPPWHLAGCDKRERLDGGVAVCGRDAVQFDDLLTGFVSGRPQVSVRGG